MSWAAVANTAKGIIAGAAAEAASTAGRTTGARLFGASSKVLRSRARRDQQYLTDMQEESNKRLFAWTSDYAEEQRRKWAQDYETPTAQKNLLIKAGLNPALMYGSGGVGGMSGTGVGQGQASQGRGTASTASDLENAQTNRMGMALQFGLMQAQIKQLESQANVNNSNAKKAEAEAKTTENSRAILIENLRQAGISQWWDNIERRFLNENSKEELQQLKDEGNYNVRMFRSVIYDYYGGMNEGSIFSEKALKELLKTEQEINTLKSTEEVNISTKIVNNEKALTIWGEYMNGKMNAETARKKIEFEIGETMNAKQIITLSEGIIKVLVNALLK